MDLMLDGKTAVVTGGASNIGRSIVLTMADEGANIVVFDVDEAAAQAVVRQAKQSGASGRLEVYPTDVTDGQQVEDSVRRVVENFGQVHILVNGVGWNRMGFFVEQPPELHEKIVDLNFMGAVRCVRAVLPHMTEHGYGRIVSLGSDAGRTGEYHEAVYSGAKAAIVALSKSLAQEAGRYGVTLNVVSPGLTVPEGPEAVGTSSMWAEGMVDFWTPERRDRASRRYPLRRLGTAQDVANVVVFLASDRCNFVTGQTWSVSGGYTMI